MDDIEERGAIVSLRQATYLGTLRHVLAARDDALPAKAATSRGASTRSRTVDGRALITHELIAEVGAACVASHVSLADARALQIRIQKVIVLPAASARATHTVIIAWSVIAHLLASRSREGIPSAKLLTDIATRCPTHRRRRRRHGSSPTDRSHRRCSLIRHYLLFD